MNARRRVGRRAPGVRHGAYLIGVALALLVSACEKKLVTEPPPPPEPPPSYIVSVFPAPRSVRVPDSSPVWAEFSLDLDSASVNTETVFFKLDTRRLPIAVAWDPATRRIRITPLERLALLRTYTVELAASIETASGLPLGLGYRWQFKIGSVRLPQSPQPLDRATFESPFAPLRWGGVTEAAAGTIRYEVHASTDSAAVADPGSPVLATVAAAVALPPARWRQDVPNFWAVHVLNLTTGERLVGPVWRFETFAVDAPMDSTSMDWSDWAYIESTSTGTRRCQLDSLVLGPTIAIMRWSLAARDSNTRIARVTIEFTPRQTNVTAETGPSVWLATADWFPCTGVSFGGPPFTDETNGRLADAFVIPSNKLRFESDRLSAHVEATMRLNGGYFGYLFRAPRRMSFFTASLGSNAARMKVFRYRLPTAPTQAASR